MADAPKRACRFVLDLEADTRDDLASALFNIASQIERGELTQGVSGGYSSGYIYELSENDRPTHTEWAQQLRAYLGQGKAAKDGVRVDADAKDAERYRFLRGCRGQEHDPLLYVQHEVDGLLWGSDLDAAIDEARAAAAGVGIPSEGQL